MRELRHEKNTTHESREDPTADEKNHEPEDAEVLKAENDPQDLEEMRTSVLQLSSAISSMAWKIPSKSPDSRFLGYL
jgi:hypothetical protein